ncbi:MAG: phage tail protein [Pyrinomonadaceae bacterium]
MAFTIPILPELDNPLLGFRFGVFIFGSTGISHPLDFRFQSVSGLSVSVELSGGGSEGTNASKRALPERLKYENLTLKRGLPLFSTLRMEVHKSLSQFKFSPRNVLVSILDENALPLSSWMFSEAFPVKWSLSELNANSNDIIVEELELKYKNFKPMIL